MGSAFVTCLLALAATASLSHAQVCEPHWLPRQSVPGVQGNVTALQWWDPDGPGPANQVLVVGGQFASAGGISAATIATYDPIAHSWSNLGSGLGGGAFFGNVMSICVMPDNSFVVAGFLTSAGGVPANRVARWNGTSWQPLGNGLNEPVEAAIVMPNGELVAGGFFTASGTTPCNHIARWNGTTWTPMGTGVNGTVYAFTISPQDQLFAAGSFTMPSGPGRAVARWNGSTWEAINNDTTAIEVRALTFLSNGDLLAGGFITSIGGVSVRHVARWDGSTWYSTGLGISDRVNDIQQLPSGEVFAGTDTHSSISQWTGSSWTSELIPEHVYVWTMIQTPGGGLIASGIASTTDVHLVERINNTWTPTDSRVTSSPNAILVRSSNDVFIGGVGAIVESGNQRYGPVARLRDGSWQFVNFNPPFGSISGTVNALAAGVGEEIYATGSFTINAPTNANNIAQWNGSSWGRLLGGINGTGRALLRTQEGSLIVAGTFSAANGTPASSIAKWDGQSWSALGTGINGTVNALAQLTDGSIIAGGLFTTAGGVPAVNLARWDGTSWSALSTDNPDGAVLALCQNAQGDLVVAGSFMFVGTQFVSRIATWSNNTWAPMGTGMSSTVRSLCLLEDGSVLAGGNFTFADGVQVNRLARWNGTAWQSVASGVDGGVYSIAEATQGGFLIGGNFGFVDGEPSPNFARRGIDDDCSTCDTIDFNNDTSLFDPQDIEAFLSVYSEGPCVPAIATCNDIDFNNDTSVFDPCDINAFLVMYSEGPCTLCGS